MSLRCGIPVVLGQKYKAVMYIYLYMKSVQKVSSHSVYLENR